jgi:hypothetical protein
MYEGIHAGKGDAQESVITGRGGVQVYGRFGLTGNNMNVLEAIFTWASASSQESLSWKRI